MHSITFLESLARNLQKKKAKYTFKMEDNKLILIIDERV